MDIVIEILSEVAELLMEVLFNRAGDKNERPAVRIISLLIVLLVLLLVLGLIAFVGVICLEISIVLALFCFALDAVLLIAAIVKLAKLYHE